MKKFIKILCLTLATVFLLSATACKDSSKDSNGSGGSNAVGGLNPTNANHYAKNQIRDEYIVYNGQSDYILVIPKDASNYEKQASSLITEYLYKACGVNMITVTDDTVYDANGKYISLGDTTLMRRSGIAVPESRFGSAGFRIVTKGDIIYISGSRHWMRKGTYYGAQEFLFHTIGWKAYTDTEIIYEERSSIKMVNFDVTEIPDFDTRIIGYDTVYFNKAYRDLLRLNANAKDDGTAIPYYAHSHFEVLPPEIYYQDHPEWYWYTEGGKKVPYSADIHSKFWRYGQLCLSNPKVIEKSIEVLTAQFLTYTTATMVHLGIMDNLYKCKCETCTKFMSDNDTNYAGINVYYTNQVARGVTENMKKLDPTRKLIFRMFAYYATIEPPVNLVNGEYVPDSELVVPDKNVYVQFTPLDADGLETLDHGKNTKHYEYFKGWCSLTNNLAVWKYNTNFYRYFISNKNWDITAEDFRMYYKAGATTMYDQGPLTDSILQMKEMRLYVESKLMWNTQYSWQALAEEFIKVYYGKAANGVLESYNLMTTHNEKLRTVDNMTGHLLLVVTDDPKYWPYQYVESQRLIFEKIFEDLKSQAESEEEYQKIYWRVAAVYFENMYMQMQFHMDRYSKDHVTETIDLFEEVANRNNVTQFTESIKASEIYENFINKWRDSNG